MNGWKGAGYSGHGWCGRVRMVGVSFLWLRLSSLYIHHSLHTTITTSLVTLTRFLHPSLIPHSTPSSVTRITREERERNRTAGEG